MKGAIGFTLGFWLALASVQGEASIWFVTRAQPVAAGLGCRLTSEELPEGKVRFVATVWADKGGQIWNNPTMTLSYAAMKPEGGTLGPLRPELPYKWSAGKVVCEFITDMARVAEPDFCFAFCNQEEAAADGIVRKTGKMDFICARLSDFMGPEPEKPLTVAERPDDAAVGKKVRGVALGLWAGQEAYPASESVGLRLFAKRDDSSPITIGVGPSLFRNSEILVSSGGETVRRIPVATSDNSPEDTVYFAEGATVFEKLPPGEYTLVWKTAKRESNTVKITVE